STARGRRRCRPTSPWRGAGSSRVDAGAQAALLAHAWPGNVRELANVAERIASSDASAVPAEALGLPQRYPAEPIPSPPDQASNFKDTLGSVERAHLLMVLERTHWNVTRAAAELGISRDTLRYRIVKYALKTCSPAERPTAYRACDADMIVGETVSSRRGGPRRPPVSVEASGRVRRGRAARPSAPPTRAPRRPPPLR